MKKAGIISKGQNTNAIKIWLLNIYYNFENWNVWEWKTKYLSMLNVIQSLFNIKMDVLKNRICSDF